MERSVRRQVRASTPFVCFFYVWLTCTTKAFICFCFCSGGQKNKRQSNTRAKKATLDRRKEQETSLVWLHNCLWARCQKGRQAGRQAGKLSKAIRRVGPATRLRPACDPPATRPQPSRNPPGSRESHASIFRSPLLF